MTKGAKISVFEETVINKQQHECAKRCGYNTTDVNAVSTAEADEAP